MYDHLLELSRCDDSNKWSNIGFGKKIGVIKIKIGTLSGVLVIMKTVLFTSSQPLARYSQLKCNMQTAWIRMRRPVTRRLIRIQAV